jgi:acetyl-CoA C-acetyltransferase
MDSMMLWEPLRFSEVCPSSDGACAMVLCNEELAKKSPNKPAWIHGTAMRSEPTMYPWREEVNPQASIDCAKDVYSQAGITNPRKELDMAEVYVPFSWYEPMWLESLGFADVGRRLETHRQRRNFTRSGRRYSVELFRRRTFYQPDRRIRHDPFC